MSRPSLLVLLCLASTASAASLQGTVVGASGGLRVTAVRAPPAWQPALDTLEAQRTFLREAAGLAPVLARTQTRGDGSFTLEPLSAGVPVVVWVDGGERGQAVVKAVVGSASLTIPLGPAFVLSGDSIVRGSPGYPYPTREKGLRVVAAHASLPLVLQAQTDGDGRFMLGSVPEGDYLVVAGGHGSAPGLQRVHLPLPPKPPPTEVRADSGSAAQGLFDPVGPGPGPRLAAPDRDYHQWGTLFFVLLNISTTEGTVTEGGQPASGAVVRLSGPDGVISRRTDATGRFLFEALLRHGARYALEVSVGRHRLRQCVAWLSGPGGSWCCSSRPDTVVAAAAGERPACRFRIALPAKVAREDSPMECECDPSDFDALDAGVAQER